MIIDFHVHHYPPCYLEALQSPESGLEAYRREDGRLVVRWLGGVVLTVPTPMPDTATRLGMMDDLGIETQVLSLSAPSVYFLQGRPGLDLARQVNDDLAEFHRRHPRRFESLAALPMTDPNLTIAELDRALDNLGMRGTMILTTVAGVTLDDPRFETFWAHANEVGLLVYVHPTVPASPGPASDYALSLGVAYLNETAMAIARLAFSGVFERYPRIRWIFSHLGGTIPLVLDRLDSYYRQFPECREHINRPPSEYLKRIFYDTVSTHRPALRCCQETVGINQMVFGSDYPHIPAGSRPFLEALDVLVASESERADLLGDRARRLLDGQAG
ncbi:MAG: amidohydrolase [Chloroflexota bacterium]|nr:amidohydrolase [Chloroflexota bacterium]